MVREHAGRLTAALTARLGDFDLAEDAVQSAVVKALERWPVEGVPARPSSWLLVVARNHAIDAVRRRQNLESKLALLVATTPTELRREADDRLRLMFMCCHPALAPDAQLALMLRAVAGLTTAEIARALLQRESAVAQRIVRAKRKIVSARIPFRMPPREAIGERLGLVLSALYLMFNEGYLTTGGPDPERRDLQADAEWLASLVVRAMPHDAEAQGLLALIRLHRARGAARFDAAGRLILLQEQDRSLWDRTAIREAVQLLEGALRLSPPGQYRIQAAIAACHAEADSWAVTDWAQIGALYTVLERLQPSPVVSLNRAIALSHAAGPAAALAEVDRFGFELRDYHLFHAVRADLLRRLGRLAEARAEDEVALALTSNVAERSLLRERLAAALD